MASETSTSIDASGAEGVLIDGRDVDSVFEAARAEWKFWAGAVLSAALFGISVYMHVSGPLDEAMFGAFAVVLAVAAVGLTLRRLPSAI